MSVLDVVSQVVVRQYADARGATSEPSAKAESAVNSGNEL
jgi:hypothetical protein